ncbi:MAG: hypothetical protein IJ007_07415 [Oscillospiraceae bacterium]|nr:hypothetical protein [Oscillospiraceae bacterium]
MSSAETKTSADNPSVNKKKHSTLVFILLGIFIPIIALGIFILSIAHNELMLKFNESEMAPEVTDISLTAEAKLKEFDYICELLNENMPSLGLFKERYGVDFNENYKIYREAIAETENNFEYYCTLKAILNDIPSCHTALTYPDHEYFGFTPSGQKLFANYNYINYTDYWKDLIDDTAAEKYSENYLTAFYFTGDRSFIICDTLGAAVDNPRFAGAKVKSVNGLSANEYAVLPHAYSTLAYDNINNVTFRDTLIFGLDSSIGEKTSLELELADGTTETLDVYCGNDVDIVFSSGYASEEEEENPQETPEYYIYEDTDRNITYLQVDEVMDEKEQLRQDISEISTDNIILDLRRNGGGYIQYFHESLYSPLFDEQADFTSTYYIPYGKENKKLFFSVNPITDLISKIMYPLEFSEDESLPVLYKNCRYAQFTQEISVPAHNFRDRNVYVLVGAYTASAADDLSSVIKENTDAVLLGQSSTMGEGRGSSFVEICLPESKLTMRYYPALAYNSDGSSNSVYGTEPDIYVPVYYENFRIKYGMLTDGTEQPEAYENRLLYDEILLKAIEEIENDS